MKVSFTLRRASRLYSIKLEPETIELLNQFRGNKHLLCFQEQFSASNAFSRKLNGQTHFGEDGESKVLKRGLNTIGQSLGIPELTSYVLRHTWATLASQLDVPKETISKARGHGKK